jgi:hypothetical protein
MAAAILGSVKCALRVVADAASLSVAVRAEET